MKTLVRVALTAAILGYLFTRIDLAVAGLAIAAIRLPHLALVLGLLAMDRCVMILRWVLLLRASGINISLARASRLFLVSSFVGSFLPAGVGADAARAYGLAQHASTGSEAVASVAVDRLLGILSLASMGIVGVIAWGPPGAEGWRIGASIAVLAAATVGVFWADRLVRALVPTKHHDGRLARRLLRVSDAVSRYRHHRGALVQVMAWSIVVQLLRVTQAYVLGLGLGLTVPFAYYLLFMPFALLLLLLPISVSGFGLPQGGIIWLLRPYDVPAETSFALSTLIVLTGLAGNLPGLWLWLSSSRE